MAIINKKFQFNPTVVLLWLFDVQGHKHASLLFVECTNVMKKYWFLVDLSQEIWGLYKDSRSDFHNRCQNN